MSAQAATDTLTTAPRPNASVPVSSPRIPASGGIRIRSIHDNRRIIILRPRTQVLLVPFAPDTLRRAAAFAGSDLERLEARLMDYMDQRFNELDLRLRDVYTSIHVDRPPVIVSHEVDDPFKPFAASTDTDTASTMVAVTTVADTAATDSLLVSALLPDSAAGTSLLPATTLPPAPYVIEVERSILDEGLLRTVSVIFEFNRSGLLPASELILNSLGIVLARHAEIRIEIGGHTDSTGPEEYNMKLSQARADAVREYLLAKFAIDPARLTTRGYGESQPIADNGSPTGRALNRRVEFIVVGGQ
ncbi:MAG: OmpA family protein [Candidatus Latescibacterota bacterium]